MIVDRLRLDGSTVLVTGAAGKIGSTVALSLAEAGAVVVLVDLDQERLEAVTQRFVAAGHDHLALTGDSADADAFAGLVRRVAEDRGAIDGLVCLVGGVEGSEFGPFVGTATKTYDAILDRNLRSAVVAHEVVASSMLEGGRGGAIVTISAATAFVAAPFHGLYGAAKAALVALTKTEAVEWGAFGIRVNTVAPGAVETSPPRDPEQVRAWERAAIPLGRRVRPDDIAGATLFLLSDLAGAITGQTLVVDGGALAKPAFLDADNVPVFVTDVSLRDRMRGHASTMRSAGDTVHPEGSTPRKK
jgi:3-oxoacyl-[acyl-carrier protein] reductase